MQMDFGPPVEERLTPDEIISICKDNGFELKEESDAGPYNYLLVFEKPGKIRRVEETSQEDKYFHGERKQYGDIDDLIKKTLKDRKKRKLQQLGYADDR
jgi:hypothetical protein